MQWLQDPNQSNVDNVVRFEASTHLRNKKKELRQNTTGFWYETVST